MYKAAVRYVPGARIDTSRPLEIVGLRPDQWREIERVYPELSTAPDDAPFRTARNTTIFPPTAMTERSLRGTLKILQGREHYVLRRDQKVMGVAAVTQEGSSYTSLHIYRLYYPRIE